MAQARRDLATSRHVKELEQGQWPDGSWGRLHSQDTRARQTLPTTEAGVERALALGLDADHPILQKATAYLVSLLEGTAQPPDPPEKNDRWPTGVQLFTAGALALVRPDHPDLDAPWNLWATIARQTFTTGRYDPDAEARAHRELTGASVRNSYLALDNKYTLALLGTRTDDLSAGLEAALLDWVWRRPEGIRYLTAPLSRLPAGRPVSALDRWLASLELLACFPGWRGLAREAIEWLWTQRTPAGGWDFGPRPARSTALPLSESWRRKNARAFDWTTRVLSLLNHYDTGE